MTERRITVEMSETATYYTTYTVEEFAALVLEDPTGPDLEKRVLEVIANENLYSSDYGIEDCDGLLDSILEHFSSSTDREWQIKPNPKEG